MILMAGFLAMFAVFLLFIIIGPLISNIIDDPQGMILVSTILLSGIIASSAAWIVSEIRKFGKK